MKREIAQADLHHAGIVNGGGAVVREERNLARRVLAFHKSVEGLAPRLTLAVVDLPEVKHLPLEDASVVEAFVFDDTPVGVRLAIFLPNL